MSKGLKALEKICKQACNDRDELFYLKNQNCKKSKENEKHFPYCDGCLYCSGNENYKIIEKELKEYQEIKAYMQQYGIENIEELRRVLHNDWVIRQKFKTDTANVAKALEIIKDRSIVVDKGN